MDIIPKQPCIREKASLSTRLRIWTRSRIRRFDPGYTAGLVILSIFALLFLFPLYWMLTGSFKEQIVTVTLPPELFPANPTIVNWINLFNSQLPVLRWLLNSLIVAGGTTGAVLLLSSMAGYAFGKKRFIGSTLLFWLMLITMMLPNQVVLIPLYIGVRKLKLLNTFWGMILPMIASPFGVFLMRQFMASIPNELMDAARIDGVSEWGMYIRIILPLSVPGLAALGIFIFMTSWNNFMWQLLMASNRMMYTLPVGVSNLALAHVGAEGKSILDIGLLMAGGTFGAIPMIIFFIAFQRYFIKGITVGAIRG